MKKLTQIIIVFLFSISMFSCQKEEDVIEDDNNNPNPPPQEQGFESLVVPSDFNWTNIRRDVLKINFDTVNNGDPFYLMTINDDTIDKKVILDGKVNFLIRQISSENMVRVYSPISGTHMDVDLDQTSEIDFAYKKGAIAYDPKDSDKDGVADVFDDYPYDYDKAFRCKFLGNSSNTNLKCHPATGDVYIILEDKWPRKGDFDFNDMTLAMDYEWTRTGYNNRIVGGQVHIDIVSVGAGYENGLGMQFFDASPTYGDKIWYLNDWEVEAWTGTYEMDDPDNPAAVILFSNVRTYQSTHGGIEYWNTGAGATSSNIDVINWGVDFDSPYNMQEMEIIPYLFRTDTTGQQVRPFGCPPTESVNWTLFGTEDDDSPSSYNYPNPFVYPIVGANSFYRTANDLPWGVMFVANEFLVPFETTDITVAYPNFASWAQSGGTQDDDWFEYPDLNHVFDPTK